VVERRDLTQVAQDQIRLGLEAQGTLAMASVQELFVTKVAKLLADFLNDPAHPASAEARALYSLHRELVAASMSGRSAAIRRSPANQED